MKKPVCPKNVTTRGWNGPVVIPKPPTVRECWSRGKALERQERRENQIALAYLLIGAACGIALLKLTGLL
jgi:hypothetical protein